MAKYNGKANQVSKWAHTSSNCSRLKAMIESVKPDVAIMPNQLDGNPWLFNCLNGTIDLKTGKRLPHQKEHHITKLANVEYDPEAKAPTWDKFLNEIFAGNEELIKYVQRFAGYSLIGDISEQCLEFLHGEGANGKTTFINAIRSVMGDYAQEAAPDLLLEKKFTGIPNDIARLRGARSVIVTETSDGKRFDEGLIKRLTGGDKIAARFLHGEFFEFDPTHKLWLISNHKPVIKGIDYAIWRRINLIPFEVTFPKEKQDKELPAKLLKELPGILAWAVRGCLEWQQIGLAPPEKVKFATEEYKTEMDAVQRFIDECCKIDNSAFVTAKHLYEKYKNWSDQNGERAITSQMFGRQLGAKGFKNSHKQAGNAWEGLSYNPSQEMP